MLQMNVSQQLKEPIGATRNHDVDDIVDIIGADRQVEGKVMLTRTDRGILVRGTLYTELELTCSRCLSLCSCPLTLRIAEEYFPTTDIMTGAPTLITEESGYFTIDEHHILDLTEAIRQYATLAAPMKPLCRENCAGLCPTCGHNQNLGECNCPPSDTDSRWAALRKLSVTGSNDL
ncbi:MAG: DUF177 domain-containing protein [Dehalococcoidales bacterium]|nr:MAG: DUF177 domain-containing protein [Dehalococcoidales bacterium]